MDRSQEDARSRSRSDPVERHPLSKCLGCQFRAPRTLLTSPPKGVHTVPDLYKLNVGPRGALHALTKPFAWPPMIVASPGLGSGLFSGIYCLTARCRTSSCSLAVAWAYSRMCWHGTKCSTMRNLEDILMAWLSAESVGMLS
jgi:hypothetical protein